MKLLDEVVALPLDALAAYIRKRAELIVGRTQGESWDDPEEWQVDAVELAHATLRLMREIEDRGIALPVIHCRNCGGSGVVCHTNGPDVPDDYRPCPQCGGY